MVVFDPESKQLVSRNTPSDRLDLSECPYCHQQMPNGTDASSRRRTSPSPATATASFASAEYFRMLQSSLPSSTSSSRPASPHRRIQAGFATPPRARPPTNAEFVGSSPAPGAKHGISATAFSPNYFKNFFVEEKELGRGNKGVVLLVKHVLDEVSLGHFALKRIPVGDNHRWLEKVLIEVQLLQHLSHQNLVSYRHVWLEEMQITAFGPSVPCAFILQQYCNGGDLHNYILAGVQSKTSTEQLKQRIRRRSKHEPEPPTTILGPRRLQFEEIYGFFKDIASGLNHLHIHNYIHRDLKPQNCLLHHNGKELRVLVSDFGEVQSEDQIRQSTGATGTISYCSPEVLRIDSTTGQLGNFTAKSDIFSLGMILHFLCFAKLPYRNADSVNEEQEDVDLLREEIIGWSGLSDLRSARPDLPDKLWNFLRRLLSLHPASRPTAEEILLNIKTGTSLSESTNSSSTQLFEDPGSNGESRISSIDTPPPATPTRRSSTALSRLSRQPPPSRLRFPVPDNSSTSSSTAIDSTDDFLNLSTPTTSLVLRPQPSSPIRILPSPTVPSRSRYSYLFPFRPRIRQQTLLTLKTAFLLLKVLSLYFSCLPAAAEPKISLALLAVATVDLLVFHTGLIASLFLLIGHGIVLSLMHRRERLCLIGHGGRMRGGWHFD